MPDELRDVARLDPVECEDEHIVVAHLAAAEPREGRPHLLVFAGDDLLEFRNQGLDAVIALRWISDNLQVQLDGMPVSVEDRIGNLVSFASSQTLLDEKIARPPERTGD